jgi:hypothetical protein
MSTRWPGGIISQTAPVPSGPYQNSTASGVWTLEQQAYWARLGQWPTAGNLPNVIEDVFSTYLYTGTGQSLAINNGIALGNGYVGGATGGSGLFDGVNDYLSVPTGTALDLSGDFTIEAWVYQTTNPVYYGIFGNGDYPTTAQVIFTVTYGNVQLYMANGTVWGVALISTAAVPLFAWTHVAVTCSGSTFTIWLNGVNSGSTTYSGARVSPGATAVIGRLYPGTNDYYFAGNMSNLRVVKGTALYTTNFTPPSSELTAVSGTQLLCLQGSTPFVDNSPNALTITNNNGTVASSLGPFPFTSVTGKGGLVWVKARSITYIQALFDTERGVQKTLCSNDTSAQATEAGGITAFNSNGFKTGNWSQTNGGSQTFASWTFREQAKFFDIVTYTGNGVAGRTVAHNLGSTPGMIIIKSTNSTYGWFVYHRGLGATKYLLLNSTDPEGTASSVWNNTAPTSTVFSLGDAANINGSGVNYVAYLFAHNAGGFGATGNENVISCGSFTGASPATINLGYEPQWLLIKSATNADDWYMFDTMRGWTANNNGLNYLRANEPSAEVTNGTTTPLTSTGFQFNYGAGQTFIYMAIRKGPMATPTLGTQVFSVTSGNFTTPYTVTTGFPVDLCYSTRTNAGTRHFNDRLRGPTVQTSYNFLATNSTAAESTGSSAGIGFQSNTSIIDNDWVTGANAVWWNFRRAPGFFDQVCYTGTGSATTFNHNLGAVPELMIVKRRNAAGDNWAVYAEPLGNTKWLRLDDNYAASTASTIWNNTTPTSSVFSVGSSGTVNTSGGTFVAYLFATVSGVSKVGSYTGTGSTQTVNCGFTSGARFVLIRRTDDWDGGNPSGDWWMWDTARGMVSGTDPRLAANLSTAQSNNDWVYTVSTGFQIVTNNTAVNASGGTYIFLAIA